MENEKGIGFVTLLIVAFIVLVGIGIYYAYTIVVRPVQEITGDVIEQIKDGEIPEIPELPSVEKEISASVLAMHNAPEDCWIVYERKIYDFTNAEVHPNMAKAFYSHCGEVSGFEEAAKAKHSSSSEDRVSNFGDYVGGLIE